MLSEVLAALEPKDGEIIVDGTFGAGGYSRSHPRPRRLQDHRHRPRSRGLSPERRSLPRHIPGACWPCSAAISEMEEIAAQRRLHRRRRRGARSRRLLHAARSGRARLLLHARTARSTCAWAGKGRPRPTSSTRSIEQRTRRDHLQAWRGAARPRHRQGHRRAARRGADRHARPSSPTSSRGCSAASATRPSTPPPAPSRRSGSISTRSLTSWHAALSAAERLLKARRPARRRHLPFARGPHRQAVFCQPQRAAAARLAPSARGRGRNSCAKLPAS